MADIELFLQGEGIPDIVLVRLPDEGKVHDLVAVAQIHGLRPSGVGPVLVFLEEEDEPLDQALALLVAGVRDRGRVHVHSRHRVEVTVYFNGQHQSHAFSPATTVAKVKDWADKLFGLTGIDAAEHALQLCGTNTRPSEDRHIGSLLNHGATSLCFNLVPKHRVEG